MARQLISEDGKHSCVRRLGPELKRRFEKPGLAQHQMELFNQQDERWVGRPQRSTLGSLFCSQVALAKPYS